MNWIVNAAAHEGGGGHVVVVVVVVSIGRVVQNDRVTSQHIVLLHRLIPSIPGQWMPIQFESSPKAPPLPTSILLLGVYCVWGRFWVVPHTFPYPRVCGGVWIGTYTPRRTTTPRFDTNTHT
jgi:hypothetical protein